ncbi:MAG: RHS repeat-associated core domain-containing protein [Acidobacteria bacterium]|nr:RHS repeat-associated core domain-containing protein [Acidobacteriota bacterium]MBK8148986.1 RHS repeat-associated core domain-containing protein [Acidobacteriota bacterium]
MTTDHLGSPRLITNQNGAVTKRQDFAAFGDETLTAQRAGGLGYTSTDELRQDYTGYQKDNESGLEYAQARYYNTAHGRFTSVDPLTASATIRDPQSFNRYSYVLNSPYKFTDPLGLLPLTSAGACGQWVMLTDGVYGRQRSLGRWNNYVFHLTEDNF